MYSPNESQKLPAFNLAKMGYLSPAAVESNDSLTMTILNGGTYASHIMTQVSASKFQSKEFKTLTKGALDTRLNQLDPIRQSDQAFKEARYGGSNSLQSQALQQLKSPEKKNKSAYQYLNQEYNYRLQKRKNKHKTDYKPFEDDIASAIYSIAKKSGEIMSAEYDPLNHQTELTPKKTLETLAYSAAATMHAYQSVKGTAQHYIAANKDYTVQLSEGYIEKLDLRYLTLNVKTEEEEKIYQILIRNQKKKSIRIESDEETAKELEELLKRLSKKGRLDEGEIQKVLEKTLRRNQITLIEEEIELIKTKKTKKIILLKDAKTNKTRKIEIKNYPKKYNKQLISVDYPQQKRYLRELENKRKDFTNNVPAKDVHKFPVSMMGGVLGFTYLGDSFIGIRDDLNDYESHEVEIHEAIHTPDEYETRQIVRWMLDNNTKYH